MKAIGVSEYNYGLLGFISFATAGLLVTETSKLWGPCRRSGGNRRQLVRSDREVLGSSPATSKNFPRTWCSKIMQGNSCGTAAEHMPREHQTHKVMGSIPNSYCVLGFFLSQWRVLNKSGDP